MKRKQTENDIVNLQLTWSELQTVASCVCIAEEGL